MAGQYEYELEEGLSPLHEYEFEYEADPFFGKLVRGLRALARRALPMLKRLAPMAARIVAGAIPGVGAVAGPLAGKLATALTQEQQQELESVLHEASALHSESGLHEYEGAHPEYEGAHGEYEGMHEYEGQHEYEGMHEYASDGAHIADNPAQDAGIASAAERGWADHVPARSSNHGQPDLSCVGQPCRLHPDSGSLRTHMPAVPPRRAWLIAERVI